MKLSRKNSNRINYFFDQILPPILRDARWFMWLPMKLVLKDKTDIFMMFKNDVFSMSKQEFSQLYEKTAQVNELQGETDLNEACTEEILDNINGKHVLEVGCGRGYLAGKLAEKMNVVGCDIAVSKETRQKYPAVKFVEGIIENLPFATNEFDTVVCTHTLEHVQHLERSISELRRVTRKRLIVVVPRQRPYKYTFSLHVHFFPYAWSVLAVFGSQKTAVLKNLGDWYYQEDK